MGTDVLKMTRPEAMLPQIAILGAGIFVRTQYIPRLRELADCVIVKAIWSRSEVSDKLHSIHLNKRLIEFSAK